MKRQNSIIWKSVKIASRMLILALVIGFGISESTAAHKTKSPKLAKASVKIAAHPRLFVPGVKPYPMKGVARSRMEHYPYHLGNGKKSVVGLAPGHCSKGFRMVTIRGKNFYMRNGRFYSRLEGRYVLVKPPLRKGNF